MHKRGNQSLHQHGVVESECPNLWSHCHQVWAGPAFHRCQKVIGQDACCTSGWSPSLCPGCKSLKQHSSQHALFPTFTQYIFLLSQFIFFFPTLLSHSLKANRSSLRSVRSQFVRLPGSIDKDSIALSPAHSLYVVMQQCYYCTSHIYLHENCLPSGSTALSALVLLCRFDA